MQNNQTRGICMFCEGVGLTKEHIWPQWLTRFLNHQSVTRTVVASNIQRGTGWTSKTVQKKQGKMGSVSRRVVCGKCNGGWMSELQNLAKPYILPLVSGEPFLFDLKAQRIVSLWVMMTVIMAEYLDSNHRAITDEDKKILHGFKINKEIAVPDNWRIWLAYYVGGLSIQKIVHRGVYSVPDVDSVIDRSGRPPCNIQTTTLVAGHMYVHASSFYEQSRPVEFRNIQKPYLVKIHPPSANLIGQGTLCDVTDYHVTNFGRIGNNSGWSE